MTERLEQSRRGVVGALGELKRDMLGRRGAEQFHKEGEEALDNFMVWMSEQPGARGSLRQLRRYRNNRMQRGAMRLFAGATDMALAFGAGASGSLLYESANAITSAGTVASEIMGGPKISIPGWAKPLFFYAPFIPTMVGSIMSARWLRRMLDDARILDRVWSDPATRQRLIEATRGGLENRNNWNTTELKGLADEKDLSRLWKIQRSLWRYPMSIIGAGAFHGGATTLAGAAAAVYAKPEAIGTAVKVLFAKGVERLGEVTPGAIALWEYLKGPRR